MDRIEPLLPRNYTLWPFQRWIKLVLPCLFAALCQGLPAASYFVAKTGSDNNPGNSDLPFLTVQKGVNTAQAGDTVLVGAGTYSENVTSARSGTNGGPIVLDGQGVATVQSFNVQNQYVHLIRFTIAGITNRFRSLLYMNHGAHHCVISNNTVDATFTPDVYPMSWNGPSTRPFGDDAASDTIVVSNTFKHGMAVTVVTVFGDRNVITGNRLVDSAVVDWFRLWGRSNHIVANLCSNNFETNAANHPDFIQTFGLSGAGSLGHIIEDNAVVDNSGYVQLCMLEVDGVSEIRDWTFRNNIFVGVPLKGTIIASNVNFYNNLFIRCATNTAGGGHVLYFGTLNGDSAHSCRVLNNVFLACGGSSADVGWYYFQTNLVNVAADYNYVCKSGYQPVKVDPQHRAIGDAGGWDYLCMLWWEPHGINGGDPFFINESQMDFRLRELSRLIGAALPLNQLFTTDILGTTRGAQWDIGAFEFQAGQTVSRPLPPTSLRRLAP